MPFSMLIYFNSTMVRLKEDEGTKKRAENIYFNSTMVRFKGSQASGAGLYIEFQFHDGSIKGMLQARKGSKH